MAKHTYTLPQTLCLGAFFLLLSCTLYSQKSKAPQLELNFSHYVGEALLTLDSTSYKNSLEQSFYVTKFKYYIGNISLIRKDGKAYQHKNYFLVDEEKPASKTIALSGIPAGEYISIRFTLGVDSLDNCSGAQSGALDPLHGMFWTWNTGYIFLKMEGSSDFSTAPNNIIEYHIGGYKAPHNYIRAISLNFDAPIYITRKQKSNIHIKTDLSKILQSPNPIDFSLLPAVTDFNNAAIITDNYIHMFSVLKTNHEK